MRFQKVYSDTHACYTLIVSLTGFSTGGFFDEFPFFLPCIVTAGVGTAIGMVLVFKLPETRQTRYTILLYPLSLHCSLKTCWGLFALSKRQSSQIAEIASRSKLPGLRIYLPHIFKSPSPTHLCSCTAIEVVFSSVLCFSYPSCVSVQKQERVINLFKKYLPTVIPKPNGAIIPERLKA